MHVSAAARLCNWLNECASSCDLYNGGGVYLWFPGNLFMFKFKSERNQLKLQSLCWILWHFIHQIKPTSRVYQDAKGFWDSSTYSWEKGYLENVRNFWTHCIYNKVSLMKPFRTSKKWTCIQKDLTTADISTLMHCAHIYSDASNSNKLAPLHSAPLFSLFQIPGSHPCDLCRCYNGDIACIWKTCKGAPGISCRKKAAQKSGQKTLEFGNISIELCRSRTP